MFVICEKNNIKSNYVQLVHIKSFRLHFIDLNDNFLIVCNIKHFSTY